jgi:glycosyltransferase involved in cell wall biosynthesis
MTGSRKLAIVPAYNEQDCVGRVVTEIRSRAPDFDVLVVDDGSTDETAARAQLAGATVLRHPFNLGIGGAVQSGFKYAQRADYDIAAQVDGDGQHDPVYLPDLVDALRANPGIDMACGSRFREANGYRAPWNRRFGMILFSVILSLITRQKITDPTSGFRMANRRGIELFARDYPHDYPEVEAILMIHANRLRLQEVPVQMKQRDSGRSSIGGGQGVYYMIKVLLAVLVGLCRGRAAVEPGAQAPVSAQRGI